MRLRPTLLLLAALVAACERPAMPAAAGGYAVAVLAEGLSKPMAALPLPNGEVLIAERGGAVRRVQGGRLVDAPIGGLEALDGGDAPRYQWLDMQASPRFADTGWVYFSYVSGHKPDFWRPRAAFRQCIGRARYTRDAHGIARFTEAERLFATEAVVSRPMHFGGRMAFLPDGTLLLTTGERSFFREQAQSPGSTLGKTLRLTSEGRVPAHNPASQGSAVWTLGHRNAQGLIVDAGTGAVYATEHGPQGGDELNRLEAGRNYGWPLATTGIDYSGAYVTPFRSYPGTEDALRSWSPSPAPSSLAQCRGCAWKEWEGDLFSGELRGRQVRRIAMTGGVPGAEAALLQERGARIRDVRFGPDGALYVLTDGEQAELLRLMPQRASTP